jgi:hypothetical protein
MVVVSFLLIRGGRAGVCVPSVSRALLPTAVEFYFKLRSILKMYWGKMRKNLHQCVKNGLSNGFYSTQGFY